MPFVKWKSILGKYLGRSVLNLHSCSHSWTTVDQIVNVSLTISGYVAWQFSKCCWITPLAGMVMNKRSNKALLNRKVSVCLAMRSAIQWKCIASRSCSRILNRRKACFMSPLGDFVTGVPHEDNQWVRLRCHGLELKHHRQCGALYFQQSLTTHLCGM